MASMKIAGLTASYDASAVSTARVSLESMADALWEQMYVKVRKVIVTCSHCGSANAITNSNCVSCGAPLGKDIEQKVSI